jgi:tetratricopeptide (TPR) repeat protein
MRLDRPIAGWLLYWPRAPNRGLARNRLYDVKPLLSGEGGTEMRSLIGLPLAAMALGTIAAPASAQTDKQIADCENFDAAGDQIAACTAVIQANPQGEEAYYNRASAYKNLQPPQYDHAIADYDEAILLDPKDAYAYFYRGYVYKELGQTDRARTDFAQAHTLAPDDFPAPE